MKQKKKRGLIVELAIFVIAIALAGWVAWQGFQIYYEKAYPIRYASLVDADCEEKGIDRALVYAVMRTESHFKPDAVSKVGAMGLMQIIPDAFEWVRMRQGKRGESDKDLFDPQTNIDCGTELIRMYLEEFDTVENALCAYHAGRGRLMEWLANEKYSADGKTVDYIPFGDTRAYVAKVMDTMDVYRKVYGM